GGGKKGSGHARVHSFDRRAAPLPGCVAVDPRAPGPISEYIRHRRESKQRPRVSVWAEFSFSPRGLRADIPRPGGRGLRVYSDQPSKETSCTQETPPPDPLNPATTTVSACRSARASAWPCAATWISAPWATSSS